MYACQVERCACYARDRRRLCARHARIAERYGDPLYQPTEADRLAERVRKVTATGCWELDLPRGNHYAQAWAQGRRTTSHRAAWLLFRGPIPDRKYVLHTCDNGACINPEHLYLGSQADNMRDRQVRDRSGIKLSVSQAQAIRRAANAGAPNVALARQYGVSGNMIGEIVRRRLWKHV